MAQSKRNRSADAWLRAKATIIIEVTIMRDGSDAA
jgi:hypothetical protein